MSTTSVEKASEAVPDLKRPLVRSVLSCGWKLAGEARFIWCCFVHVFSSRIHQSSRRIPKGRNPMLKKVIITDFLKEMCDFKVLVVWNTITTSGSLTSRIQEISTPHKTNYLLHKIYIACYASFATFYKLELEVSTSWKIRVITNFLLCP